MNRRDFVAQSLIVSAGLVSGLTACKSQAPSGYVFGHSSHQYRLCHGWCKANASKFPIKDAHEMVQANDGRLFLLTNETKNNILIFNTSGEITGAWGSEFPAGHGLTLNEEGGEEFLYITDHDLNQVYKYTLDGRKVLTIDAPLDAAQYNEKGQFKPTETAIDSSGNIYVADGYGQQYISVFDQNGKLQRMFGGTDHFQNAHGVTLDNRGEQPSLLISAREQNALKRFSLEGNFMAQYGFPGAYLNRAVVKGENVYLSVLKTKAYAEEGSGIVMVLDKDNQLISCPTGTDPSLASAPGLHQTINLFSHPHDVCIDKDDNLYVAQWNSGGVYPIMLERI